MVHRASLFAVATIVTLNAGTASPLDTTVLHDVERTLQAGVDRVDTSVSDALGDVVEIVPERTEGFQPDVDRSGSAIERGVWLVLAAPEDVEAIVRKGFGVRELRKLEHLDRVLLRIEASLDRKPAEAQAGLAIDHNHLYHAVVGGRAGTTATVSSTRASRRVIVGLVDSAIATKHDSLRGASIEQRDFVSYHRPRPAAHGTAIASILVGEAAPGRGVIRGARLRAASVFFQDEAGESVATTASLVRALDWLAGTGVRVINMSLAGPPNQVLEAALDAVAKEGIVVTAAVGNDGPSVAPRYPAAYESVAGITAVDAAHRVYLHANRGHGVMFAAPGVGIDVARADGGYESQSGTSLASAYAAGIFARAMAGSGATRGRVLADLKAAASDLGEPGFDETFGHGLIKSPE